MRNHTTWNYPFPPTIYRPPVVQPRPALGNGQGARLTP